MKYLSQDSIFPALLVFLVGTSIAASAWGMEQISVLLVAIAAGLACMAVGVIYGVWRMLTNRPVALTVRQLGASMLVIASVALFHWPLRLSYLGARSSLDEIASRLKAGDTVAFPQRAGLFNVHHGSSGPDGIACLWLSPTPDYSTGFVQTAPDHLPLNLWSVISLDREWQYVCLD